MNNEPKGCEDCTHYKWDRGRYGICQRKKYNYKTFNPYTGEHGTGVRFSSWSIDNERKPFFPRNCGRRGWYWKAKNE